MNMFDVIVIGAGHAGCEAALACSNLKLNTLILTINLDKIAIMACNPSIGGVGKSQLVREIDAIGGQMGRITDKTGIQFKVLNRKKGPAVQALRAQIDKKEYENEMKWLLENTKNIILKQATVSGIITKNGKAAGVIAEDGTEFYSKAVVVTSGTFLRGRVIIGEKDYPAGRMGEYPAVALSQNLKDIGFEIDRFQTATPPRVDKRSVDFSAIAASPGDEKAGRFSFWDDGISKHRINIPSFLTYTNKRTHDLISKNINHSPIKSGIINTHGPRHCPSIDRKVINFPEKDKHPVFIEPEGSRTNELYLQGLTTSMPFDIQQQIVNTVEGLEHAKIIRPGYAVEYDFLIPSQLNWTLESKLVENLYFAGQINGTSGYEEAAAQGLVAGINAALKIRGSEPMIITRDLGYIGVLIDDLITKDLIEPYRMYTSRAEYRLLLRSDNADLRLSELGYRTGLLNKEEYNKLTSKKQHLEKLIKLLKDTAVTADSKILRGKLGQNIKGSLKVYDLLKRPEITIEEVKDIIGDKCKYFDYSVWEQAEIIIKYEGYIAGQQSSIRKMEKLEKYVISPNIDYFSLEGLTYGAKEKLSSKKPNTLGQASRIAGVSPADISLLMLYLKGKKR